MDFGRITYQFQNKLMELLGVSVLVPIDETVRAAGLYDSIVPGCSEDDFLGEIERRLNEISMVSKLIDQQEQPRDIF